MPIISTVIVDIMRPSWPAAATWTCAQTVRLVTAVTDADLERVVDTHWSPPVPRG
jgi:hypothetical protein